MFPRRSVGTIIGKGVNVWSAEKLKDAVYTVKGGASFLIAPMLQRGSAPKAPPDCNVCSHAGAWEQSI